MNVSFTPDGDYFVFSEETGETLKRAFRKKVHALSWINRQLFGGDK